MAIPISHLAVMTTLVMAVIIAMNAPSAVAFGKPKPKVGATPTPPETLPEPTGDDVKFKHMLNVILYCGAHIRVEKKEPKIPKVPKPNKICCAKVKEVNIQQFCKSLFASDDTLVEKVFSPHKLSLVAKQCNNPLPVGSKCGSYVVKSAVMMNEEEQLD